MARPLKQKVDYFPHDANASNGKTLFILESKFGNDGYAFWFKLLERLADTPGHFYDCRNPSAKEFLLAKTRVNEDTARKILDLLADLEAIDSPLWHTHKVIWSQNLVSRLADVYNNRRAPLPQKPSFADENLSTVDVSTTNNPQSKVKESKVKESKSSTASATEQELLAILHRFPAPWGEDEVAKLREIEQDFGIVVVPFELKKFVEWWATKKCKRPWVALRNWLERVKGKELESGFVPGSEDYNPRG